MSESELLTNYIFPRFIYNFLINPPSEAVLKLLDNEIRQKQKTFYTSCHPPPQVSPIFRKLTEVWTYRVSST